MLPVAFIGDELTATGYRLAGATVFVVPPAEAAEALRQARDGAELVLIGPMHAGQVAAPELSAALAATRPLTLIVDDIAGGEAPPDVEQLVRRALGLESS